MDMEIEAMFELITSAVKYTLDRLLVKYGL